MPGRDRAGPTGHRPGTDSAVRQVPQGAGVSRSYTGEPDGIRICPRCEHQVTHARGGPCIRRSCPKCGAPMTRQ